MDSPNPRRHLSVEEAKLRLLTLGQPGPAGNAARASGPLGWIRSRPYQAAAAAVAGLLVARLFARPRAKVIVKSSGAAAEGPAPTAAAAKSGAVAAAVTYLLRQLFQRYLAERLMAQAQTYFLRAHQSSRAAPRETPWGPAARP